MGHILDKLRIYREHADYHVNDAHKRDDCPVCMGKLNAGTLSAIRDEAERCFKALGAL